MNKTNTKTEYQVVRNFFNDAQWDLIDAALNEYQDHFDTDEDSAILDSVGEKLQNVFDNSVDQSDLMSEGAQRKYATPYDIGIGDKLQTVFDNSVDQSDDDTFIDINNSGGKY